MGADFIGAMCPMEIKREDSKERLRRYKEAYLLDVLSDYFCQEYEDDDSGSAYEQAISWVDLCIDNTYDYMEHGSRETTVFNYKDISFLVTGGPSWGDDPTDAYQYMSVVQALELTVATPEAARFREPWK